MDVLPPAFRQALKTRVYSLLPSGFDSKLVTKDTLSNPEVTLTSLFLWRSWFGDILGSCVNDGFGECLALFVFQWSDIGEFQRTERNMEMWKYVSTKG